MRHYVANPRKKTLRWPVAPGVVVLVAAIAMIEVTPADIDAVPGLRLALPMLIKIGFVEIEADDDAMAR